MSVAHLEVLVEEDSMEAALRGLLPRLVGDMSFEVYPHQGKDDLLRKLPQRLHGYAAFLPSDWRIVVVIDRDDDDCRRLKQQLEYCALQAGLATKATTSGGATPWLRGWRSRNSKRGTSATGAPLRQRIPGCPSVLCDAGNIGTRMPSEAALGRRSNA